MDTSNIEIEEYIRGIQSAIPEPIKKVISEDTYRKVSKNALATVDLYNEDLIDAISLETFFVLIGLQTIPEFYEILEKNIVLSGKGGDIAKEIDAKLFTTLESSFNEMYTSVVFLSELETSSFGEARVVEKITKEVISELTTKIEKEKQEVLQVSVFTLYTVRGLANKSTDISEYDQNVIDLYNFFNKK